MKRLACSFTRGDYLQVGNRDDDGAVWVSVGEGSRSEAMVLLTGTDVRGLRDHLTELLGEAVTPPATSAPSFADLTLVFRAAVDDAREQRAKSLPDTARQAIYAALAVVLGNIADDFEAAQR